VWDRRDWAAYCWGRNIAGQLGDGTTTNRLTPTLVSGGLRFVRIAAGANSTCALDFVGEGLLLGWEISRAAHARSSCRPLPVCGRRLSFRVRPEHWVGRPIVGAITAWANWVMEQTPVPSLRQVVGDIVFAEVQVSGPNTPHTCA